MRQFFRALSITTAAFVSVSCRTTVAREATTSPQEYVLPIPSGDSARLIQGNNGPWGHTGVLAYAFDFVMPIGSAVTAARGGRVVGVEARYVDGNRTPGQENYIFIAHGDGTFGRYYHLTQNGVRVHVGDRVASRDTIGRSGNTGASAGPHLHFDITLGCPEWGCQTVPVHFRDVAADSLVAGRFYRAGTSSR